MSPATTLTFAKINESVKKMDPVGSYTPAGFAYNTGFVNDGFWGCVYVDHAASDVIVCFKGTGSAKVTQDQMTAAGRTDFSGGAGGSNRMNETIVRDLIADLKLTVGVIPNQASTAKKFFKRVYATYPPGQYTYSITGHSLGGYLAQVVSYWYGMPCVSFNGPGAWGDLQKAKVNLFKPQVMLRSIKATFQSEDVCVNFIHVGDIVGNFGVHRGRTVRIAGLSHMMKAVRQTIEGHPRWANSSPFDARTGIAGVWDKF